MADENEHSKAGGKLLDGLNLQGLIGRGLEADPGSVSRPSSGLFEVPELESVAEKFPDLEILEFVGRGGMGVVYAARQRELGRMVALKVIPEDSERRPEFAERFRREACAMAMLSHPNIVAIHDFGQTETGSWPFILMEYVEGGDLHSILEKGKLPEDEAMIVVMKICDALDYAHAQGVVHRDIKPSNILVDTAGELKVSDFGLAKVTAEDRRDYSLTLSLQVVGTEAYMSPEQLKPEGEVDHRADIYSLGIMFYQMLTGELPRGAFPLPSKMVTSLDERLDSVVHRLLQPKPGKRFQKVKDLKSEVEFVVKTPPGTERISKLFLAMTGGAIGLVGFGLAAAFSTESEEPEADIKPVAPPPYASPDLDFPTGETESLPVLFHCTFDDVESVENPALGPGANLMGARRFVEGRRGKALHFTAEGKDRIVYPSVLKGVAHVPLKKGEVDFWYRPDYRFSSHYESGIQYLFSMGTTDSHPSLCMMHMDQLELFHRFGKGEGDVICAVTSDDDVLWEPGEWVHIRATWDSAAEDNSLRIFLNGKVVHEKFAADGWSLGDYRSITEFTIGSAGTALGESSAEGAIDDFYIRGNVE